MNTNNANTNTSTTKSASKFTTKNLVSIAILSALSFVIMLLEVPLPFLFPDFLKLDFSDVPAILASIIYGPLAAVAIEALKNILHIVIRGSFTGGVGELANFLVGAALVIPVGLTFKKERSKKQFFNGAVYGLILMCVVGVLTNLFITLPLYASIMNTTTQAFVDMSTAIFPFINTMPKFLLFTIVPFNLLKGLLEFLVCSLVFSKIKNVNI